MKPGQARPVQGVEGDGREGVAATGAKGVTAIRTRRRAARGAGAQPSPRLLRQRGAASCAMHYGRLGGAGRGRPSALWPSRSQRAGPVSSATDLRPSHVRAGTAGKAGKAGTLATASCGRGAEGGPRLGPGYGSRPQAGRGVGPAGSCRMSPTPGSGSPRGHLRKGACEWPTRLNPA